jgi:hypothetical protein
MRNNGRDFRGKGSLRGGGLQLVDEAVETEAKEIGVFLLEGVCLDSVDCLVDEGLCCDAMMSGFSM